MDNFLSKMERKFGKYAIRNLPLYLLICYAFGYLMNLFKPEWIYIVNLNPYAILHGQVWRLFTWILVPEETQIFFIIIVLYFYYSIGRQLERTWGSFLFNVYFFSGFILTIIGAFLMYLYFHTFGASWAAAMEGPAAVMLQSITKVSTAEMPYLLGGNWFYAYVASFFSTYYINLSIFLAFAITYPEMKVYLFFVIPIKVKFMGIVYVVLLGVSVFQGFFYGGLSYGLLTLVSIGASLINTLLFFLYTRKGRVKSPKEIKRQRDYKVKMKAAEQPTHHKCAICGQTEESNPGMAFRYCSKCKGNYEYCSEHLFTHKHVE